MKTKALLSLITALCICGCITGCGSSDNENDIVTLPNNITNDKTESQNEENTESQNNDSATENDENSSEIKIADEVLNADMYSDVFQVGEKVIKLPMTAKELFEMDGVELGEDSKLGISQGDDPATIVAHPQNYKVIIDGVETSLFFIETKINEKQLLSDCNVISFGDIENVVFPKGVKVGMPIDEVRRLWGEPDTEDVETLVYLKDMVTDTYVKPMNLVSSIDELFSKYENGAYSSTGYCYEVEIDLKTKTVSNIRINNEYLNYAKNISCMLEDIRKPDEIQSFSDWAGVLLTNYGYDVKYELPAYMNNEICAYVYEVNGQKYAIHKYGDNLRAVELDIKEYTDDNLKKYIEKKTSLLGMIDPELFTYTVKKDGNRAVIITRDNSSPDSYDQRESYSKIQVHCLDENFVDIIFSFVVAPCNGKESISDEELESADSWFFDFAKSVKATKSEKKLEPIDQ